MPTKKITIEIDEDVYLKIKDIAMSLYPGVIPPPAPDHIIKFLVDKYKGEIFLDGAAIINNKRQPI
jgi:hypothetical protein